MKVLCIFKIIHDLQVPVLLRQNKKRETIQVKKELITQLHCCFCIKNEDYLVNINLCI